MAKEPKPIQPVEHREKHDVSFEEGLQEALSRIAALYEEVDRDLLVVINGSWMNVGKTRLEARLRQALMEQRIWTDTVTDDTKDALKFGNVSAADLEAQQYRPHKVHFRIIQGLALRSTQQYRAVHAQNPDLAESDLIIAIYRPDKPFNTAGGLVPVGDIVIRNDQAVDK